MEDQLLKLKEIVDWELENKENDYFRQISLFNERVGPKTGFLKFIAIIYSLLTLVVFIFSLCWREEFHNDDAFQFCCMTGGTCCSAWCCMAFVLSILIIVSYLLQLSVYQEKKDILDRANASISEKQELYGSYLASVQCLYGDSPFHDTLDELQEKIGEPLDTESGLPDNIFWIGPVVLLLWICTFRTYRTIVLRQHQHLELIMPDIRAKRAQNRQKQMADDAWTGAPEEKLPDVSGDP